MSSSETAPTIGFIGAGNMARSLAGGLVNNGHPRARILLADPDAGQRAAIQEYLGLTAHADNQEVAGAAQVLVLAVKPQALRAVAQALAPTVARSKPLIISLAAGVRSGDLERWLGAGLAIVRAMPNTAALIGSGATGLYANRACGEAERATAESLLRAVGVTAWVEDEALMDVVTALSGSGPAYFFLVMEALEAAAVHHGLDRKLARLLTLETAFGAAKMALEGGEEPARLRARVTSPGGTTEQALQVLEGGHLRPLFDRAIEAAMLRGRELGQLLGKD